MFDALVLGGGKNSPELLTLTGTEEEALVPLGEKVMAAYVVEALAASSQIARMAVVGPAKLREILQVPKELIFAPPGRNMIASVINGFKALGPTGYFLVATVDIPLVTTAMVDDFLSRCTAPEIDFYYAVVRKEASEAKFPGVRRTYVRLREGTLTGGNLFLVRPEVVETALARGEAIYNLRKNPWGLVRLIGFRFALKFLLGRLPLAEAEKKFSNLLGLRGITVTSPYPEVGVDIDKPSDYLLAQRILCSS